MKAREILIYLSTIYKGDWNQIFETITAKKQLDEKEIKKVLKNLKSKVVTCFDDDYPQQLKTVQKPPFVLYYHGDLSLARDKHKSISVVGSRKNSPYGEAVTNKLVKDLCKELVIVSGMARGIDGIAHRACIANGGKSIAVLGCGINVCYPASNLDVYDEMKKHHLILSEYPDLTEPNPLYFPIRNRIIAALSDCLLVTEGQRNSGTSITATITLENGGNVCCVPTRIGENSVCNHLIAYGAALVETAEDIYLEMGYRKNETAF
ncbi:MAG: DNA-processing protein DprA [Bacilli bacterium]|nr:DNA-processing protein DprA [Bacilli bacterium]